MTRVRWFAVHAELPPRARTILGVFSFILPILVWCVVSYVPSVWHPLVLVTDPGSVDYFQVDMRVDRATFDQETASARAENRALPEGVRANPIYLPAPDEVLKAFYTSFTTPPEARDSPWLHQSLWHSIQVIFWGFVISSVIGVPLGILCGTYTPVSRISEPFIEFFRYLPAPALARSPSPSSASMTARRSRSSSSAPSSSRCSSSPTRRASSTARWSRRR